MIELGERLKNARIEKGMDLEEIQAITKIQTRYLQAIEAGEYEKLPGSFYIRAFVKSYAEAVGLNMDELLADHGHELPTIAQTIESLPPRKSRRSLTSGTRGKLTTILPRIVVISLIIGVLVVIWLMNINNPKGANLQQTGEMEQGVEFESNETAIPNEADDDEPPVVEEDEDSKQSEPETDEGTTGGKLELTNTRGDTSTFTLSETHEFNVVFTFAGDTWLKIQGGQGKTYVNEGFTSDETAEFSFTDDKDIRMRIGNTTNVTLQVNGIDVELQPDMVTQTVNIQFEKSE